MHNDWSRWCSYILTISVGERVHTMGPLRLALMTLLPSACHGPWIQSFHHMCPFVFTNNPTLILIMVIAFHTPVKAAPGKGPTERI